MGDSEAKPNQNKRKRKKTFLQNARKYAKKGYYGRGSRLDADTYQYFVKIMEAYKEGFETDEEKLDFVNNVFEQTKDNEINCCCNQVGCRVIETLLPFANDETFKRYMQLLGEDLRPLSSDRFATHVLEAMVKISCERSLTAKDDESKSLYKNFTIKVSKFLLNNLEDFVWDTYGNHVMRTVIRSLANLPSEEQNNQKNNKKVATVTVKEELELDDEYKEIVNDYAERLITWPQFKDLAYSEISSGFLQVILKALAQMNDSLLKKYLKKLIDESFFPDNKEDTQEEKLSDVFLSNPCMMLLETALQVAKSKMYTQIYAKGFSGKLHKLAVLRTTNFAVQKLLTYVAEKIEFEAMFDELDDHFKEIIDMGHTGVILAIAETCKRLSAKQGPFVQNLMKALNCLEPEDRQNHLVVCVSRLKSFEDSQKMSTENLEKEKLKLHGTLILQVVLDFNKPIKIVNSVLNTDSGDLKKLFCNTMGSHIVDSYVRSQYVGEKSREKLVKKLQGTYQDLINSKFGSRSFEAIWGAASLKWKMIILNELSYKDALWTNTEFGKIIAAKINFAIYKRNKEEWKSSLGKSDKKNDLLDFLDK